MAVAFSLGWLFGLKKSQRFVVSCRKCKGNMLNPFHSRSFAMAAAMFMNSNSLPIALMQSLVVSVPGLKWGKGDNKNAMVGRALTYLVVYSTLGMVLRWSYGVRLLSQADDELEEEITITEERASLLIDLDSDDDRRNVHASTSHQSANHGNRPLHPRRRTTYYKSFPNSPTEEENLLGSSDSDSETFAPSSMFASRAPSSPASDNEGDDEPHTPLPIVAPPRSTAIPRHQRPKRKHSLVHRIRHLLRAFFRFMTVPLWAALAAVFVACTPPVQHTLESHLLSVKHALSSAGNCSIPLTLVVLGAYFHPGTKKGKDEGTGAMARKGSWASRSTETLVHSVKGLLGIKKPQSGPVHLEGNDRAPLLDRPLSEHEAAMAKQAGETKTVVIAVLSRMVITPLLIMPVVALSAKYDWHRVFEE
ncbi:hypothetical protein H0H81_005231 [Sphagnurus paluster]|uniref:Uncharacterized protein n=1 Tax=Sphagnurus paluster TaxID=117069 RepID=A0A9P7GM77_9AGAR|nr:hypothetical protein H0H81_005231 [Sphagnurus paluster]